MSKMATGKILLFILFAAFTLRAAVAVVLQHQLDTSWNRTFLIEGDANGYWELGRRLATEGEFSIYDPPRHVMRMPGFPMFLAISMKLSNGSFLCARIFLALVGAAACGAAYLLGTELFDEKIGLMAAAMTACSPTMIGFSPLILTETLFAAFLLVSLWLMAKLIHVGFEPASRRRGLLMSLLVGVMIAVACYVRPSWLLISPFFAAVLIGVADNKRQAFPRGALVVLGTLAALAPWAVRNYNVTGHFVLTTLWVGPSLYDGFNPHATGDSDLSFFDREQLFQTMTEFDVDHHYRQKSWEFISANPVRAIQLTGLKLWRFWKPWPNAKQFSLWWQKLIVTSFFLPLLLFALYGWWLCRRELFVWLLTVGPILYFSDIHMVFVGSLRYRLPAEYPLCVLTAVGLNRWWQARRNRTLTVA